MERESYESSPVIDFEAATNTLEITSKKTFFSSLFKDKVEKRTIGAMISEEIELDLEISLADPVSGEIKTYKSKLKLTQFTPVIQITPSSSTTTNSNQ